MKEVSFTTFFPENVAHHCPSAIIISAPQTMKIAIAISFCDLRCSMNSRPVSAIHEKIAVFSTIFFSSACMACSKTGAVVESDLLLFSLRRSSMIGATIECGRLGHAILNMLWSGPCCTLRCEVSTTRPSPRMISASGSIASAVKLNVLL